MVSYDAKKRRVTTLDHRERAPLAMNAESFFENGAPLALQRRALQRPVGRRPGHGPRLGARAAPARDDHARAGARAGDPGRARRASSSTTTFFAQIAGERSRTSTTCPATAALYLDPDGTPRDVGTVFRNPDLARTYRLIARRGARGFYRGPLASAIAQTVRNPQVGPTADHVLAAGRHDGRRPARLHGARARAGALDVPRPRRLRHGPAVERRLDGRRGAEHPRGLRPAARCRAPTPSTSCSRPRAWPSPTAARTSPTAASSRSRAPGCCRRSSPPTRRALIGDARRRRARPRPATRIAFDGARAARRRAVGDVDAGRHDDAPHGRRPARQRRLVHVHDRVHRRLRPRRARLRLPAQQRADGLQLHLADAPQPRPGRQAPAQLDGADDRAARRAPVARRSARPAARRSSRRCSGCSSTGSTSACRCPRRSATPRASQRDTPTTVAEAGVPQVAGGRGARRARARVHARWREIGAATGIELLGARARCSRPPSRCAAAAAARSS